MTCKKPGPERPSPLMLLNWGVPQMGHLLSIGFTLTKTIDTETYQPSANPTRNGKSTIFKRKRLKNRMFHWFVPPTRTEVENGTPQNRGSFPKSSCSTETSDYGEKGSMVYLSEKKGTMTLSDTDVPLIYFDTLDKWRVPIYSCSRSHNSTTWSVPEHSCHSSILRLR